MAAPSLLLFTKLRSRETEELGVVEGHCPAPRTGTCWGKRPCALYPKCSFAARFIGESLAYCGTFRLCGSLIGRNIPRGMSLSLCYRAIGGRAVWGGLCSGLAPVCVSAVCFFFPLWRGPGGGRRRVDLNVFGSPVLWPRVGSCRCWGGPFFLALRVDWCPSWSPPSASSTHRGLGGAGPSALPESHRLEWIAATFRPRGHGGAGLLEVAALTFSALAPRRRH